MKLIGGLLRTVGLALLHRRDCFAYDHFDLFQTLVPAVLHPFLHRLWTAVFSAFGDYLRLRELKIRGDIESLDHARRPCTWRRFAQHEQTTIRPSTQTR